MDSGGIGGCSTQGYAGDVDPRAKKEFSVDFVLCAVFPFHIGKSLPTNQTFPFFAHEKTITCLFIVLLFKQTLITLNSFVMSVSGKRE